jgi:hypothetical protein
MANNYEVCWYDTRDGTLVSEAVYELFVRVMQTQRLTPTDEKFLQMKLAATDTVPEELYVLNRICYALRRGIVHRVDKERHWPPFIPEHSLAHWPNLNQS